MVKSGKGERESERVWRRERKGEMEREGGKERPRVPFSLYSPHYFLNPGVGGCSAISGHVPLHVCALSW